jgi:predicted AAA+ superfamily ATPase
MVNRLLVKTIAARINQGKVIILLGARQVGKTTLLKDIFGNHDDILWLNGDETDVQNLFTNVSVARFKAIFGTKKVVVIDEAQRIADVGLRLKLIADEIKDVQLIATGSSAFELVNRINEPLTGRKWEYLMFPLSFQEMVNHHGLLDEKRMILHRLVYGYYPEIVVNPGSERELLTLLTNSYLYKDILQFNGMHKPDMLVKLLQTLALQVGSQVSYNELAQICGVDGKTVEKYLMLLEQTFVIFRLRSFSRNLRNELKNTRKIFFYDNGIRNALIANFNLVEMRTDVGMLWENFLMAERQKWLHYNGVWANSWFWRTRDQKEIDYVEECDGRLVAYEFKWNPDAKAKVPAQFISAYANAEFNVVHRDNFEDFLPNLNG